MTTMDCELPRETNFPPEEIANRIINKLKTSMEISSIYRSGKKKMVNQTECQNLVFKLRTQEEAMRILSAAKEYIAELKVIKADHIFARFSLVKISIFRFLPPHLKKLKWLANKKKETLHFKCWINTSGNIMLEKNERSKPIWIQSESSLEKVK